MKNIIMIALGCISISLASTVFASCGGCGSCGTDYCSEPESPCACTDPGWKFNTCMSKAEFCRAFGNMGELDD